MSPPTDHERRFVAALRRLADNEDRAALAALRRGLGKPVGEVADLYPYVVPWLPPEPSWRQEQAFYLVAALFAWHQRSWSESEGGGWTNLGASFARLADDSGSIEGRFVALLNCHRDELPDHLRSAVGLLKAKEIHVDWAQLLRDVQEWEREDRKVQRDWARAFWGSRPGTPGEVPATAQPAAE